MPSAEFGLPVTISPGQSTRPDILQALAQVMIWARKKDYPFCNMHWHSLVWSRPETLRGVERQKRSEGEALRVDLFEPSAS
jgi:hypothetical protein